MASALEFSANAFDAESLYGLRMIISWISVAVFIWLLSLSYLVWKADSKSTEAGDCCGAMGRENSTTIGRLADN